MNNFLGLLWFLENCHLTVLIAPDGAYMFHNMYVLKKRARQKSRQARLCERNRSATNPCVAYLFLS
jgi:hypothetical protein